MLPVNDNYAISTAVELAKILCESNGNSLTLDADGANALADFIETLERRLIGSENQPDK